MKKNRMLNSRLLTITGGILISSEGKSMRKTKLSKHTKLTGIFLAALVMMGTAVFAFNKTGANAASGNGTQYVSLFYGDSWSSNWGQAVDVATTRCGGEFDASNIKKGGHFYVEYSGTEGKAELIFQSMSGGASWAKVEPSEKGYANGHYFMKYSYDNCVKAFGTDNFVGLLDKVYVGATDTYVNVYSLCYDYGKSVSSQNSASGNTSGSTTDTGNKNNTENKDNSQTVTKAENFYVDGTTIRDANGNEFIMRGINVAHAWYTGETKQSIEAIAKTGANTVRVVVADGQTYTKTSADELRNIISWCKENNLVCVFDVHDATGQDDIGYLNNAVNYWKEMKDILNENSKFVILNIANYWYGKWNCAAWADGNKSAIKSLRDAGIKNLIMVDCAGWGQYPDSIKDYGRSVYEADKTGNTVFSIHMYEYAGGDAATVKKNIDNALSTGVPVVIGEFGCRHTNGDVDEYTIMSYCKEKKAGYIGWSWKGNGSDWIYLDLANTWDGSSLTEWGKTLIYDTNGIKNTSKICSVYTGKSDSSSDSKNDNKETETKKDTTDNNSQQDPYVSVFWGNATTSWWQATASSKTNRAGGEFNASDIKKNGYFYVEYSGDEKQLELILQSWSGGANWAKVQASEYGSANGHYFAKFSYDDCVKAFGTSDFASKLAQINVGAKEGTITVYSVAYCQGR